MKKLISLLCLLLARFSYAGTVTSAAAGPLHTITLDISSLSLDASTIHTVQAQCWTGTGFSGSDVTGKLTPLRVVSVDALTTSSITLNVGNDTQAFSNVVCSVSGGVGGVAPGGDLTGNLVNKITGATKDSTVSSPTVLNIGPDYLTSAATQNFVGATIGYKGCCTDIGLDFIGDVTSGPTNFPGLFIYYETYDANASPQAQQIGFFGFLANSDGTGHQTFQGFQISDTVDYPAFDHLADFCNGYITLGNDGNGNSDCTNTAPLGEYLAIGNPKPGSKTSVSIVATSSDTSSDPAMFGENSDGSMGNWKITHGGSSLFTSTQETPVAFGDVGTCNSGAEGTTRAITDASTNTWGATVTGGGSNHVLAYCDGTNWTVAAK